jgi:hypothetical protein
MINKVAKLLLILMLGLNLSSCTDGLSSNNLTLKGTAATGAAISGSVEVTGSDGKTATTEIEADGTFNIKVTRLSAPYILRTIPDDGSDIHYSYASGPGIRANITPTTTIAMFLANGNTRPDVLYDNWVSTFVNITSSGVKDATALVNGNLELALTDNGLDYLTYDFFSEPFEVGAPGYDALLDMLTVNVLQWEFDIVVAGRGPLFFNFSLDISGFDIGGSGNNSNGTDGSDTFTLTVNGSVTTAGIQTQIPETTLDNIPGDAVPDADSIDGIEQSFENVFAEDGEVSNLTASLVTSSPTETVFSVTGTVTTTVQSVTVISEYDLTYAYTIN